MSRSSERSLRIAMISYYLPSGSKIGVGYQVHQLATALQSRGHQVTVISDCPPVKDATYDHLHQRMTGSLRTFRFALANRRLDLSSYDVLHAHGDDYWMWRRRVPRHVRTLHGSCFEEARFVPGAREKVRMLALGLTEWAASAVADKTVVVSPGTRRWAPWVRRVIPNGVDTRRFRPHPELPRAERPTVLFVGTWNGRKRGADLARVVSEQVRPFVPDVELRMVTQDAPDQLPRGVVALGRLSDEDLAREYARAWVFCLPSDYEGFGIPYAEALASGLPVVATPNTGARYVLDEGRAGMLAGWAELGPALTRLLRDDGERETWGRRALERSSAFSIDTVVDAYLELYRPRESRR